VSEVIGNTVNRKNAFKDYGTPSKFCDPEPITMDELEEMMTEFGVI